MSLTSHSQTSSSLSFKPNPSQTSMAELKSSSHSLILSSLGFHKGQARMTNTTTNSDGYLRHHHRGWPLLLCSFFLSISYFSFLFFCFHLYSALIFGRIFLLVWLFVGLSFERSDILCLGFVSNGCVCILLCWKMHACVNQMIWVCS